jgi:SAM-dependent methyltransferase
MKNEKWNERYKQKTMNRIPEHSAALEEAVKDLSPGKALDLAAGTGRNAFYLARRGWEVTAVEFSDVAVEAGRRFASDLELEVEWIIEDLTAYKPQAGSFDLITIFYLHLPWSEFRQILQAAAAALCPGGKLLVVGHDSANLTEGSGGPQDPDVLYSPEMVAGELMDFNLFDLEIEFAEKVRMPVDHGENEGTGTQIDCVVRAARRIK